MRLETKKLSFRYHTRREWVLKDLDFSVEKGECIGLSAPSGSGKSTLALLLAGYLKPVRGEIQIDGKPLPQGGICPVQLIYQHPEQAVDPRWRLRKVLEESGQIREDILDSLGIERAWMDRFPRELSDFLVCDEISTMLDVITQAQIWSVVCAEAQKRDMGIVVITHNQCLAKRLCSRIYELPSYGGNYLQTGTNI